MMIFSFNSVVVYKMSFGLSFEHIDSGLPPATVPLQTAESTAHPQQTQTQYIGGGAASRSASNVERWV